MTQNKQNVGESQREKFLTIAARYSGNYATISVDPVIIHIGRFLNYIPGFIDSYRILFESLKHRPIYLISSWWWHAETEDLLLEIEKVENELKEKYPNITSDHLCNTPNQLERFEEINLNSIFCNHNSFLDENIFKPINSISERFDAVYDSRIEISKRHYLAESIQSIAFIYYFPTEEYDRSYYEKVLGRFPHAHLFNNDESGKHRVLRPREVNRCLNECRVGLCLSQTEGAMFASAQYLLSGLPVVSTESFGGRDEFFDEEYTVIVEDDPEAVNEAVEFLIQKQIPSDLIRKKTIDKMLPHRERFIDLVQKIYDESGCGRKFKDEWDKIFFNKMVRYQTLPCVY